MRERISKDCSGRQEAEVIPPVSEVRKERRVGQISSSKRVITIIGEPPQETERTRKRIVLVFWLIIDAGSEIRETIFKRILSGRSV